MSQRGRATHRVGAFVRHRCCKVSSLYEIVVGVMGWEHANREGDPGRTAMHRDDDRQARKEYEGQAATAATEAASASVALASFRGGFVLIHGAHHHTMAFSASRSYAAGTGAPGPSPSPERFTNALSNVLRNKRSERWTARRSLRFGVVWPEVSGDDVARSGADSFTWLPAVVFQIGTEAIEQKALPARLSLIAQRNSCSAAAGVVRNSLQISRREGGESLGEAALRFLVAVERHFGTQNGVCRLHTDEFGTRAC